MPSSHSQQLSFEGMGLRYRLLIIEALIFVLPVLILSYIFYKNNIFLDVSQLTIVAFILVLVLSGLIILRQIFDKFFTVATLVRKAVGSEEYAAEIQRDTDELREITVSFNNLSNRLEKTTGELQRRVFEIHAIKETVEVASKSLNVDELMDALLEKALAVSKAKIGSVFTVESEKQRFRVAAYRGVTPGPDKGSYIPIEDSLARFVVSEKGPLLVEDIEADPRIRKPNDPKYGSPSFLSMPIFVQGHLMAVLNLSYKETNEAFDSSDKNTLSIMIGEIGFALENALLHSTVEEHVKTLQKQTAELTGANNQLQKEIADRKRVVEALQESEARYRLLVENANDAVFITQDNVLKFPNPKTLEMTGFSADELARIPFMNLIHPEDRDMVMKRHKSVLTQAEAPGTLSFRLTNKPGEELWGQLNTVRIDWEGKPAELNFLRDITHEKKFGAKLQQIQKMEAIGTLAGGIAHDFNNLLMGIQGNTSLMLLDVSFSHPHYNRLKRIEESVQRGADLTQQLLSFARGGKYEVKTTDLNNLINNSSVMFGRTKKEIRIHRKFQKDIWPVEVDQGQVEQVFVSLYVNAWEAMREGGDLCIQTENVVINDKIFKPYYVEPGKYVKISLTDTGVGMDPDIQKRIFEPFFTTKEMGRGTGLGLAAAYGAIKNHGGYITVHSEKAAGTEFDIYLPVSEKESMEENKIDDRALTEARTVLIADDEETVLDVCRQMLIELGYEAFTARSGNEAIETLRANKDKIDLVILDMIMPDRGAAEIYDRMKEIHPRIKVLLSSGYSIDGKATEIMQRGCDGFIQKPFNLKRLSQKIKKVLAG